MLLLLQIFYSGLLFKYHSEDTCSSCSTSAGVPTDWMNYCLRTIKIKMGETYFHFILLNPTPGISTHFNIKWKQKSYTCHSTNEDHLKENRKWGIFIVQWKNCRNMIKESYKPEIRPQKIHFFVQQGAVLCTRLQGRSRWDLCPFKSKFSELLLGLCYSNWCTWAMAAVEQNKCPWPSTLKTFLGQPIEERVFFTVHHIVEYIPTNNLIGKWVFLAIREGLN